MRRCRRETYTEGEFRLTYIMAQIPLQVCPSPEYPGLHLQLKDPLVLLQTALALHLFFSVAHSSISIYLYIYICMYMVEPVISAYPRLLRGPHNKVVVFKKTELHFIS